MSRWIRLGLIALVLVGVGYTLWIEWIIPAANQRQAVQWVLNNRGTVSYAYEVDSAGVPLKDPSRPVPQCLMRLLGKDAFSTVVSVHLEDVADLSPLAELPTIKRLEISGATVSHVKPLGKLTNLEELYLRNCSQLNDLSALRDCPNLYHLDLFACRIDDVSSLRGVPSLRRLHLGVTDMQDLRSVSKIQSLEVVDLAHCQVRDLSPLEALPNLVLLDITSTPLTVGEVERFKIQKPKCYVESLNPHPNMQKHPRRTEGVNLL